jgi:hypothetical protein
VPVCLSFTLPEHKAPEDTAWYPHLAAARPAIANAAFDGEGGRAELDRHHAVAALRP